MRDEPEGEREGDEEGSRDRVGSDGERCPCRKWDGGEVRRLRLPGRFLRGAAVPVREFLPLLPIPSLFGSGNISLVFRKAFAIIFF